MKPKALIVASVASMIDQFNIPNIKLLIKMGYQVDVACNFTSAGTISSFRTKELIKELDKLNVNYYQVDFDRNVFNLRGNYRAYKQIKKILKNNYDLLHSHSPIGGVVARLAANKYRKNGLKSIYTAHGFHFFKGAPKKNWILFYPVEKILSRLTDKLIVINKEDYKIAKERFNAKEIIYIPGVGVDIDYIKNTYINERIKRQEFKIPINSFIILSVGELNKNKNHEIIIKSLSKINNPKIHYIICGTGPLRDYLEKLILDLRLDNNVHLLGYRDDVIEICKSTDVFAFPSKREGLGMAAIEAMACGLPLLTSDVHGINDYSIDNVTGYKTQPDNQEGFKKNILKLYYNSEKRLEFGQHNKKEAEKYCIKTSLKSLKEIYNGSK